MVALVACLLAVVPPAWAATGHTPDKLLREYPLEQRPTTVADAPRGPSAAAPPRASSGHRLTQGTTMLIAGAVMVLAFCPSGSSSPALMRRCSSSVPPRRKNAGSRRSSVNRP